MCLVQMEALKERKQSEGNMAWVSESKAPGPSRTEILYGHEYDAQGNRTEKTTSVR